MSLHGETAQLPAEFPRRRRNRWLDLMLTLGSRLSLGEILVELPNGERLALHGAAPGPSARLQIRRERMARRLLLGGSIGIADAYVDGDFDSDDLVGLLTVAALNEQVFSHRLLHGGPWRRALGRLLHALRANTPAGSRRNIAAHYDLGNAFYAQWLDPALVYSCALFDETPDLARAQQHKFARLAALAEIRPGQSVLEIGCGWGGFALYLARQCGARVTAITISRAQYAHAAQLVQQQGLAERVELRLQDYRHTTGSFDRIVSVEMLEAVGERYWPTFFRRLRERLVPQGRCALQCIVIADRFFADYRRGTDFIQRYIFPGGMLPARAGLIEASAAADLNWLGDRGHAADYVRTLAHWRQRFEAAWPSIEAMGFDARFRRLWRYYLCYCQAGFATGSTDLLQIALARD